MIDTIFCEDCRVTLKRLDIVYDYVLMVPPDFSEIGLDPGHRNAVYQYIEFTKGIFESLRPRNGTVTTIITDRKNGGQIYPKHIWHYKIFIEGMGWQLISSKIWCKSLKANLYRLNFAHIQTFAKGKHSHQQKTSTFKPDVWDMPPTYTADKFPGSIPLEMAKRCIAEFTEPGQVVFDPFMGSGTVAVAAKSLGRHYLGAEICKETWELANQRLGINTEEQQSDLLFQ